MNFPHTVIIKSKTNIDLGNGSFREGYSVGLEADAFLQPKDLQDVVRAGRKINSKSYNCYISSSVTILGDDRIEYEGDDYSIVSEPSWMGVYKKVFIEKIV